MNTLLLASLLGMGMHVSIAEAAGFEKVTTSQRLRMELQERYRAENRTQADSPIVEDKLFSRYQDLAIWASVINKAVNPENYILRGHFDPQRQYLLDQKITEPFLINRGIKEIIAVGVSDFSGSTPRRIQNIEATLEKFDGQIVAQGEAFSFNKILEEVSEASGFTWERVIKDGSDKWEIGGGVCQVSSTIYRAALNAGVLVSERRNHSYPVSKYMPQGLDATIYLGAQDFKFVNDTPGDILMKFVIKGNKLVTVFYGTRDERQVGIRRTKYWEAPDGRLSTHWVQTVQKGEDFIENTIISHYRADPNREAEAIATQ